MTQFWTDFSEYATGSQPSDWTNIRDAGGAWSVVSDSGAAGGQLLSQTGGGESLAEDVLVWDGKNGSDIELVAKLRRVGTDASSRPILRLQDTAQRNLYFSEADGTTDNQRINKYDGDSFSQLSSISQKVDTTSWYWLRFRANSSSLELRTWVDGDTEPTSWDQSATDSSFASGETGIGRAQADFEVDIFGVGTGGDTAPKTEPTTVPTAPSNLDATVQ